jgi:DNA-binding Xre family transcriptional regulator
MMTLNEWRLEKGIYYEDLAKIVGLSTNKVYRLCAKPRNVNLVDALQITEKIPEITLQDFLK